MKRQYKLNLEEIQNEKQRAIAYIISEELHRLNWSNKELAEASGVSVSTVSNIFRKETKIMPGTHALQSIALGLSQKSDGTIDHKKAEELYARLLKAAQSTETGDTLTLAASNRSLDISESRIKDILINRLKDNPNKLTLKQEISAHGIGYRNGFDMKILVENCKCLSEWNILLSLDDNRAYSAMDTFFATLFVSGIGETSKYSILATSEKVYELMQRFDLSAKQCYISVIEAATDGTLKEKYLKTALSSKILDKAGLSI